MQIKNLCDYAKEKKLHSIEAVAKHSIIKSGKYFLIECLTD